MKDDPAAGTEQPLAAQYALGLLDADRARDFEAELAEKPALRASYAHWASHFAAQTEAIAPVTPPAHVFQNIDKAIFLQAPAEPSLWSRLGWVSLVAFGSLAICVTVFLI